MTLTSQRAGLPDVRQEERPSPAVVERTRLVAASVVLVVLALVQQPGRIAPDSKLDLSVDPAGFLARAWNVWEPLGAFGQLQNQAYGYFLPMGPFYVAGHAAGLPPWLVQRLWWALLLLVAFHGTYRLAGRLGIGTPGTRLLAAAAYALSPRILSGIGAVSIEIWPMALAPWVLVPLVSASVGRERTAAARSGLAVAVAGGVNAVAVAAVLPLGAWWLLTRRRSRSTARLAAWWSLAVVLAITWWLVPLLVLGRYSPPFLDWIESAAVTTSTASLPAALRGATHWVPWLGGEDPLWPAGFALLTRPVLVALSWVVVGLGVAGLLRRDLPHRVFLCGGAVAGILLLTLGHAGPLAPPWAVDVRVFLDGAGAPLRNTHKFDLLVRLPVALGLAHVLATLRIPAVQGARWTRHALRVAAVAAVVGLTAPAFSGSLPARGSVVAVPAYWQDVADWLAAHPDGGRALVVPGAPFATSLWGDLRDEPLQPLARTPWAVRDGVPLSSAGNIRLLTRIEQVLAAGRGSPGLAEVLARAGVSRLVVRADLADVGRTVPRPATVRATLTGSPGLRPVATFGGVVGTLRGDDLVLDDGLQPAVPTVEVWEVEPAGGGATLWDAREAVRVTGGTEALLDLAEAGLVDGRPVVLADDPQSPALQPRATVATDTAQRREASFARVRDVYTPPLTAAEPWRAERAVHDWSPFEAAPTTAVYDGPAEVTASSNGLRSSAWAGVDGDPGTAWTSAPGGAVGQWLRLRLTQPASPGELRIVRTGEGADLAAVDVVTASGTVRQPLDRVAPGQPPATTVVALPPGETDVVEVRVAQVRPGSEPAPVVIADVQVGDLTVARPLVLPTTGARRPDVISLREPRDVVDGCLFVGDRPLCSPAHERAGEAGTLDRELTLGSEGRYLLEATARPLATAAWDAALRPLGLTVVAQASSRRSEEPAERPQAAVDADLGSAWVASAQDRAPTLSLRWQVARRIDRMQLQQDPALAASRAVEVRLRGDGFAVTTRLDDEGWVRFAPVTTTGVDITVLRSEALRSLSPSGGTTTLPVGLSEVFIPAVEDLRRPVPREATTGLPCGFGPAVTVSGRTVETRVEGTVGQVLRRDELRVVPCDPDPVLRLPAGAVRVTMPATDRLAAASLVLRAVDGFAADLPGTDDPGTDDPGTDGPGTDGPGADGARSAAGTPVEVDLTDPGRRTLSVDPAGRDRVLVVHENENDGWRAVVDGEVLAPLRMDGWQQAWLLPAGTGGTVVLEYLPGAAYRAGLVGGAFLLALLLALALKPSRGGGPAVRHTASPPPEGRRVGPAPEGHAPRSTAALAGVVLVALAGGWGLAAAILVAVGVVPGRPQGQDVVAWVAVTGVVVAGAVTAARPTPVDSGAGATAASAAALLVVAALATSAVRGARAGGSAHQVP